MKSYNINISQHGRHWGRVTLPDTNRQDAQIKAQQIFSRFNFNDGFMISLTEIEPQTGREIDFL